ncbi:type II secretion system protein M [Myxococcota bacterium]|nr:type II secretion system protein M [Myxococcota bacterium]
MSRIRSGIDSLRLNFSRLTQREQLTLVGGAGFLMLFILVVAGSMMGSAISKAEYRIQIKSDQLTQVLQLQGEYLVRQKERESRIKTLGRSNIRLVSLVEEAAKKAGVEIGQLSPSDGEPGTDDVVESRVDLRVQNLSIDRLHDFLSRLEKSKGIVIVQRLKIDKPYKRDTLNVEMTVTTFKIKKS